jgi:hypothetical protein
VSTETVLNENGQAVETLPPAEPIDSIPPNGGYVNEPMSPMAIEPEAAIESTVTDTIQAARLNTSIYVERAKVYLGELYADNRELLKTLGWIFVGFVGLKLAIAGLEAIEGIPFFSPLLKLIGLYYVGKFAWRYLLRDSGRQELMSKLDNTKAEVFGGHDRSYN